MKTSVVTNQIDERKPGRCGTNKRRTVLAAAFLALLGVVPAAWAGNILIINGAATTSEPGTTSRITANLNSLLVAADNTTTISSGVPAVLTGYDQIWDIRFDNNVALTASEQTQYIAFLASGKGMFVMGENATFPTRNNSVLSLITAAGGARVGLQFVVPSSTQIVQAPFTEPNVIPDGNVTYAAPGGVQSPDGGQPGTGQFITQDTTVVFNSGTGVAFGPGTLLNAAAGALTVIFDVNFMQGTVDQPDSQNLLRNLIQFVTEPPEPQPQPTITTAASGLNFPFGVADGSVYIADRNNHKVWKIGTSPTDLILVAGTSEAGYNGDGILATTAQLNSPTGVALSNGNLFIADSGNHIVRKVVLSTGIITTVAGLPQKNGIAVNGGAATLAELFGPRGVATDAAGNIYIADTMNQQVRKVAAATGVITAVAGVAGETGNNDGPVASARLNSPLGVAVDSSGSVVAIADEGNDSVRMVTDGVVDTVAAGTLDSPSGVAFDGNGNLYIADTDNHRIQRVSGETVTTVAGGNGAGSDGDGGPATAAQLNHPVAVAVDSTCQFLYIADLINNKIRKVDFTTAGCGIK